MIRKIIHIDEEKCNGCGACATACHEGAIGMVDGKAKLLRDDYCDGLGDCLPSCPTGAITFVEREAKAYDHEAVMENMKKKKTEQSENQGGCPGSRMKVLNHSNTEKVQSEKHSGCPGSRMRELNNNENNEEVATSYGKPQSRLGQWPCQIKLVPINAPYFDGAKLLIAADCTAYAYANIHEEFMKGKITLIGCPKLDEGDYSEKLTEIIKQNNIQEVTIIRMEVPCCGGLEMAAKNALQNSGKFIPWRVVTVSINGEILD